MTANTAPQPAQQPPKRKAKTLWIILGVVGGVILLCCGIAIIASVGGGGGGGSSAADATDTGGQQKQDAPVAAMPKIGSPVRDGKFEFTIQSVKCGVSRVGNEFLNKSAQGQYCLVGLKVKNVGDEPRTFDSSNQRGFGTGEVKYHSDGVASLYANENNESFLNEINPGNTITANVVFDIPKDGQLVVVELHDSAFSGGTKVSLTS